MTDIHHSWPRWNTEAHSCRLSTHNDYSYHKTLGRAVLKTQIRLLWHAPMCCGRAARNYLRSFVHKLFICRVRHRQSGESVSELPSVFEAGAVHLSSQQQPKENRLICTTSHAGATHLPLSQIQKKVFYAFQCQKPHRHVYHIVFISPITSMCVCVCVLYLIFFFSLFGCVTACAAPVCDVDITFSTPISFRQQGTEILEERVTNLPQSDRMPCSFYLFDMYVCSSIVASLI